VPVIDVAPLAGAWPAAGDDARRRACIEAIADACARVGFFHALGHGVDERVQARTLRAASDFFALPAERKERIANARSYCFRGYVRQGLENTAGVPDEREQIEFGREEPPVDPAAGAQHYERLRGPNQWPEERDVPGFREAISDFARRMTTLGEQLTRAICAGLGRAGAYGVEVGGDDASDARRLERLFDGAHLQWKVCKYPLLGGAGDDARASPSGVGSHADSGFLTLLVQDCVGGLQAQLDDGGWVDVAPVPGSVVVNMGEMLQLASAGRVRATVHRVIRRRASEVPAGAAPDGARLSAPFFYNPRLDAPVGAELLGPGSGGGAGGGGGGGSAPLALYGENAEGSSRAQSVARTLFSCPQAMCTTRSLRTCGCTSAHATLCAWHCPAHWRARTGVRRRVGRR